MKALLRKVKWNKGEMENGTKYDYTRIYIEVPIYDKQEREFGVDVLELEFGDESEHSKLVHLRGKLPCQVEVDFIPVKKGNASINVVTRFEIAGQLQDKKA